MKKEKRTATPRRATEFTPDKWPGHLLKEYQFPAVGHIFLTRAAAGDFTKLIGYTRFHGVKFKAGGGNYPKYSCPKCPGLMGVSFGAGPRMSGRVTASVPCTCPEKSVCKTYVIGMEFSSTDELIGTILLYISRTEDTFVAAVYNFHLKDPLKTRSNGTRYCYSFITKENDYWQLTFKKKNVDLGTEKKQYFFVQKLEQVVITKHQAIESLVSVGESVTQKATIDDDIKKQDMTVVDLTENKDAPVADPIEKPDCMRCCEQDQAQLVRFLCPATMCQGPVLCRNDLMKFCATRSAKPLANNFGTHFNMTHEEDGVRCPLCRTLCTKYVGLGKKTDPVLLNTPFGWIGERAERNKSTYDATMKTFRFIVLPVIEAYNEAGRFQNQAESMEEDFSLTQEMLKANIGEEQVKELATKHRERVRFFKDEKNYYERKVKEEHKWLKIDESDYGEPNDIPQELVEQAKQIELGKTPALKPAEGYRHYSEICMIKKAMEAEFRRIHPGNAAEMPGAIVID